MKNLKLTRRRLSILTTMLVSLLLLAAPLRQNAARLGTIQATQKNETLIFVVSGEESEAGQPRKYSMDALVVMSSGKLSNPMDEYNEKSKRTFADKYYKQGQKYRLLFGGGEAGTATVQGWQEGCNAIHSSVAVESSANIRGRIRALATNSETLGKRASARRALTSDERAAVMTLVQDIYRQHKTTPALLRQLKNNNLTAVDLDGDGKFEVIGDFQIQTGGDISGARRDLFLIATPAGKGYRAELASFQSYKMDSGFGRGFGFLDYLDLDGDGIAEVVTIDEGFDAYGYSIYKKQNGKWQSIYSATGDAC